jgi:hypothetical protein
MIGLWKVAYVGVPVREMDARVLVDSSPDDLNFGDMSAELQIKALKNQGHTVEEIAEAFNTDPAAVEILLTTKDKTVRNLALARINEEGETDFNVSRLASS